MRGIQRIFALVLAVVLWWGPMGKGKAAEPTAPPQPAVSAVHIHVDHPPPAPPVELLTAMAEQQIGIRPGDPFSPEAVEAAIAALTAGRGFSDVHADVRTEADGIVLIFRLTPFRYVKDVRVRGQFPLFEKVVLQAVQLTPGDVYVPEHGAVQAERVRELYRREGFEQPEVTFTAHEDAGDGNPTIEVSVTPGPFFHVTDIDVNGNTAYSDGRLRRLMRTWLRSKLPTSAGRFVERDLKTDIRTLTNFYRKRGYPEVTVQVEPVRNEAERTVRMGVDITQGPRYDVQFEGNRFFSDRKLRKDLEIQTRGNRNDAGIRRGLRAIRSRYREAGFQDAQVTFTADTVRMDGERPVRTVRIAVAEGPRTRVERVTISGNRSLDPGTVSDPVLTRPPGLFNNGAFVSERLEADVEAIRSLYRQMGFGSPAVEDQVVLNPDRTLASVDIAIDEGPQTRVSAVTVTGVSTVTRDRVLETVRLKPGEPFRAYMTTSDENAIATLISEQGYPHVKVQTSVIQDTEPHRVRIAYRVDSGPPVTMGSVVVTGNFKTRTSRITEKIRLKPGDPFSLRTLAEDQEKIRNMTCLKSTRFRTVGLEQRGDRVDLWVQVEEKRSYYLDGGVGFDSQKGFFADGQAGNLNLMGLNRNAWLAADFSEIGHQAELGLSDPELGGTPVNALLSLFTERRQEFNQDFGVQRQGAALSFSRQWTDTLRTGLGFHYEQREQFDRGRPEGLSPEERQQRTLLVATPSFRFDTRDSFIRPSEGFAATASVEMSTGLDGDLDDFFKTRADLQYYTTPFSRLTLAFMGRLGHIETYGGPSEVPEDQLFFLGGIANVRGFAENKLRFDDSGKAVGGLQAISATAEARIDMGGNFELACFADAGRVGRSVQDTGVDGWRGAVGLGLRYITPVGPIGLLYGHKLDRQPGEGPGRIHFSIGYTF